MPPPNRGPRRFPKRYAVPAFLLGLATAAPAFDLAGVVPTDAFAGEPPAFAFETINDSNSVGFRMGEYDDARSYGFQAYASWRGFALGAALEGFTFRESAPATPLRSDELALTAAWMSDPVSLRPLYLRLGGGLGLRSWGDFGSVAIQDLWHASLQDYRPAPTEIAPSSSEPFAYASAYAALDLEALFGADASLRALALGSGGVETSMSLRATQRSRGDVNWLGIRRDDRLGAFGDLDSRANSYERGTWLLWGAGSGFLYVENSMNLEATLALCNIGLRFGGAAPAEAGPGASIEQELAVGTSLLGESVFTLSRSFILGAKPEIHIGAESRVGVPAGTFDPPGRRFQEGSIIAEAFLRKDGARAPLQPFAGAGLGLRSDTWTDVGIYRSAALIRETAVVGKVYAGFRLDLSALAPFFDEALRLDLYIAAYGADRPSIPASIRIALRVSVAEG
jgi:hypothetical protein